MKRMNTMIAGLWMFSHLPVSLANVVAPLPDLDEQARDLAERYVGTMDSSDHSLDDPRYFDVTLHTCFIKPTWEGAKGYYIYLEQAMSLSREAPYRQRVVQMIGDQEKGVVVSTSFKILQPETFLGLCSRPEAERVVAKETLKDEGCPVFMKLEGENFVGGTGPEGCPSVLRGAVKATSEVTMFKNGMDSWDRGFDANGKQVWGATLGPYHFKKVKAEAQAPLLVEWGASVVGNLDNSEQSAADADFSPIKYRICQVRPTDSSAQTAERFFYAEQAITLPGREFLRQTVYHLVPGDNGSVNLQALALKDPTTLVGLCDRSAQDRLHLEATAIVRGEGCTIQYQHDDNKEAFVGATPAEGCPSTFRGAKTLKIEEEIAFGKLSVWERWYDAEGKQVAGSTKGPYLYLRKAK